MRVISIFIADAELKVLLKGEKGASTTHAIKAWLAFILIILMISHPRLNGDMKEFRQRCNISIRTLGWSKQTFPGKGLYLRFR